MQAARSRATRIRRTVVGHQASVDSGNRFLHVDEWEAGVERGATGASVVVEIQAGVRGFF